MNIDKSLIPFDKNSIIDNYNNDYQHIVDNFHCINNTILNSLNIKDIFNESENEITIEYITSILNEIYQKYNNYYNIVNKNKTIKYLRNLFNKTRKISKNINKFVESLFFKYKSKIPSRFIDPINCYLCKLIKLNVKNNCELFGIWLLRNAILHCILLLVFLNNKEYLNDIYLGIYGSKDYKSDIDISIIRVLNNNLINKEQKIDEIIDVDDVKIQEAQDTPVSDLIYNLETSFINLLNDKCLNFDIEFYSNFLTLPSNIYYMNMNLFDITDLKNYLLEFAFASVIRNLYFAGVVREDEINLYLNEIYQRLQINFQNVNYIPNDLNEMSSIWNKSKLLVESYTSIQNYEDAINEHRKRVQDIEIKYYELLNKTNINKEEMLSLFQALCFPNIYREESYICPSTVYHVVFTMQKNEKPPNNECNSRNIEYYAYCNIGICGYILSMIEQMGYIKRFEILKESTKNNNEKIMFDKKIEKYTKRYDDAFKNINQIFIKTETLHLGGSNCKRRSSLHISNAQRCKKYKKHKTVKNKKR